MTFVTCELALVTLWVPQLEFATDNILDASQKCAEVFNARLLEKVQHLARGPDTDEGREKG